VLEQLRLEAEPRRDVGAVEERRPPDAAANRLCGAHDLLAREGFAPHAPIQDKLPPHKAHVEPRAAHPIALRLDGDLGRPRLVVAFRPLLVVPHLCWLGLWAVPAALASVAAWFAALATGRVPGPLHRFLASFLREAAHVSAFLHLVGRPYPGFLGREDTYPIDLTVAAPERQSRLAVLARLGLAVPAVLLAAAFAIVAIVAGVLAWFAALATGRVSGGLRDLGAAALRYEGQTVAYLLLLTARYPDASPRIGTPTREDG
jgi:hypothetical protein